MRNSVLQNFYDSQTWQQHLPQGRSESYKKELQEGTRPALLRGGVRNVTERGLQCPDERCTPACSTVR